ncbi:AraC family transcriptional regulator [Methylobacterium sp. CM6257]
MPPVGFIHLDTVSVELGADLDALAAEAGLDPRLFDDSSRLVPFTALSRLMALAADHTRCPHLGLLIGQHTTLTSLGPLGLLLRNSNTLGDALRALEAHLCVRNRGAEIVLHVHHDIAVLSYVLHEPEVEGAPQQSEWGLAEAANLIRALCSPDWAPLEVLLPRSAPRDTAPYRGFFRAPVRFDQEGAALVVEAQLLEERIVGADPAVRQHVEDRIRQLEAKEPSSLADDLRHQLRIMVTRQRCKAERVARQCRVTRRTLSRRLKAEGTTFRQLATEARFRVAKQLLADTALSLTQISTALNFSEPAAFTHAFRRWTGVTPTAWRQANRPPASLI